MGFVILADNGEQVAGRKQRVTLGEADAGGRKVVAFYGPITCGYVDLSKRATIPMMEMRSVITYYFAPDFRYGRYSSMCKQAAATAIEAIMRVSSGDIGNHEWTRQMAVTALLKRR